MEPITGFISHVWAQTETADPPGARACWLFNQTIGFPVSSLPPAELGGLSVSHRCVSQFLRVNQSLSICIRIYKYVYMCTYMYIYIIYSLLALFPWTILIHHYNFQVSKTCCLKHAHFPSVTQSLFYHAFRQPTISRVCSDKLSPADLGQQNKSRQS